MSENAGNSIADILTPEEYAIYANTKDTTDPRRAAIEAKVAAHFEARYGATPQASLHPVDEDDVKAQVERADTPEYVSCMTPAEAQQARSLMEQDLREFFPGADGSLDTWREFALAVGEPGAARAIDGLTELNEQFPEGQWRNNPEATRQVHALNAAIDQGCKNYLDTDRAAIVSRLKQHQQRQQRRRR